MRKKENLDKYERQVNLCNEAAMYTAAVVYAIWKITITELQLPVSMGTKDPEIVLRSKLYQLRSDLGLVNDRERPQIQIASSGNTKAFSHEEIFLLIDELFSLATSQRTVGLLLLQMHLGNRKVITAMKAKIQPNPESF